MKKRLVLFFALVLALVTGFTAMTTTTANAATDTSLSKVQKKGTLVMGTSPDYPLMNSKLRSTARRKSSVWTWLLGKRSPRTWALS